MPAGSRCEPGAGLLPAFNKSPLCRPPATVRLVSLIGKDRQQEPLPWRTDAQRQMAGRSKPGDPDDRLRGDERLSDDLLRWVWRLSERQRLQQRLLRPADLLPPADLLSACAGGDPDALRTGPGAGVQPAAASHARSRP